MIRENDLCKSIISCLNLMNLIFNAVFVFVNLKKFCTLAMHAEAKIRTANSLCR